MKKLRIGTKVILGTVAAGAVVATATLCATLSNKTSDPLRYEQEVNVKKYAASSKKEPIIDLFPHNYHSMDFDYQKLYWLDVTRENVHDPVWKGTPESGEFEVYHPYEDDITLDRFTNLCYPRTTIITLYEKNSTEGNAFNGEGEYKDQSVLTNWTSQNGFAYLSDLETPFDTQKERDDLKKESITKYNETLEKYNKANSFLNFFGGNRDIAQYFFSGIQHMANGGDGIGEKETVDGQTINIETAKITKHAIDQFIYWLVSSSSIKGAISFDFSQLYLKDLDRDNSILALLNPRLWEYIIKACYENGTRIASVDLSYNNLRIVPNFASIRNWDDSDWFWDDLDGTLGIGYGSGESALDPHYGGMNKVCEGSVGLLTSPPQTDGYFDGIDLSHNNLTYFDYSGYNPWNRSLDLGWSNDPDSNMYFGKEESLKRNTGANAGNARVPSLTTLVKCRYESFEDVYDIFVITDPSKLKPKDDELIGVNIDYNRLPWLLMNPLCEENDPNYVWWRPMLESWYGLKIHDLLEPFGINLPNYILTCARAYLTYTVANYNSENIDSAISILEYVFGLGTYQIDGVNWTTKEAYNYIVENADGYGRSILSRKKATDIKVSETVQMCDKYLSNFINVGQLCSFTFNKKLVDPSPISIYPHFETGRYTSNGIGGELLLPIRFQLARISYLPNSFDINDDISINELATKIFNTININYISFVTVSGFVKDYAAGIGVAVGLSAFALIVIIIVLVRVVANIRHQYEYRRNELGAELSQNEKQKKIKKVKK